MTITSAGILGTVLGPISARGPGGAGGVGFFLSDFPYDFAIGGLPFLLANNPREPYQRVTGSFRKDQIDQASNVGDQSLTGWWTRGQFSFHQGAGIRYNDAFTDDETGTRYFEGVGINPWTPGQVTLSGSHLNTVASRHGQTSYMLGGYNGFTPTVYYVSATDSKFYSLESLSAISASACGGFAVDPNPGGTAYYLDGSDVLKRDDGGYTSTQTDSTLWQGLWFVHSRLLAVDDNGAWYELPAQGSGASVAAADAFWSGDGFSGGWSVADSPGAIFIARGRTIYKITLDTSGGVPTLAPPAATAEVPNDETVVCLAYYLGSLVIVTNRGVRIGQTDSEGNVQYGAAVVEFVSSTCRTVAAVGSRVYCTGTRADDDSEQIFVMDLAQPVTPGVFAYTVEATPDWDGDGNTGVTYSNNQIYAYSETTLTHLDGREPGTVPTLAPGATGTLETGFLRLGTMEPKAFHSVYMKLDGDEGSVDVEVIKRGGAATLLTNLPASHQADYNVMLDMSAPEEYIALRFTLIAGATGKSPTLLGYQVRALPAPAKRTRMIQVPLSCFDWQQAPGGAMEGGDGYAAKRLFYLEALEEAAGLVVYQDFRTGEQRQAFIEQLAFEDGTPSSGRSRGYGGTLTATLRLVS